MKKIITNLLCFDLFYKQQQTLKLSNLIKMVDKDKGNFNLINNNFSYFNNFPNEHTDPSMCKGGSSSRVEPGGVSQLFTLGKP